MSSDYTKKSMQKSRKFLWNIKKAGLSKYVASLVMGALFSTGVMAQTPQYGDLEVAVLGYDGLEVQAIDIDLQDTTIRFTENSIAFFTDLYIYTLIGLPEPPADETHSLSGKVRFYSAQGVFLEEHEARENGTVHWPGDGNTGKGIVLLQDEKGVTMKFLNLGKPLLLGKSKDREEDHRYKTTRDESNIYEIRADGRVVEWDPFDLIVEQHELFADITNYVTFYPVPVPDGPATGQVEISVDGEPAGDNSEVKIVRTGETDTTYLYTSNGIATFDASDGITSHPFGNFTRDYTILINSFNADSNWFHAESNEVDMALGPGNNFSFTPEKVTDEERTANINLEIILTNGNAASENAEVKVYRIGETDTVFAYTNSDGIAQLDRLVHPFQADNNQFSINSDQCDSNFFTPLTEDHDLFVGQNDIEMNPDPIPENFAEGPVSVWFGSGTEPGTEIKIWRLNNTIDTVIYTTNTAGMIYYTNLPIEGSSSDYVFQSEKIYGTDLLTSLDTFNLITGSNPMLNIYLQTVTEYNHAVGTVREFYNQDSSVENVVMEIWERNADTLFASCITDTDGYWHIDSIPLGFEAQIKMFGLSGYFNRFHEFDFPDDVLIPGGDSTIVLNMLHVPYDMIIPQTANDPAPPTLVGDAAEVAEMVGPADDMNGEEIARFENRIYLVNFHTPSDSAIYFAREETIDSLFYGGQGSPLVLVSNSVNITSYHQQNYDINIGFPGELGWNLTNGGGNVTSPTYSNLATGHYILGGEIHITGELSNRIKELQHRRKQRGDVTSRPSYGNPNPTMPNEKDRAYDHAIDINLYARVMTGNEVFPLDGLTTSTKSQNAFKTGDLKNIFETTTSTVQQH